MAGSRWTRKGKPKGVYTEKRLAGIAPYNWNPGPPSPNPGGRPRQHKEMVAKLRERADWIADAILALIEKGLHGELTTSDKYLSQHLWETWQAMFGRHAQSMMLTGGLDVGDNPDSPSMGGLTALLRAVYGEEQKQRLLRLPRRPTITRRSPRRSKRFPRQPSCSPKSAPNCRTADPRPSAKSLPNC